MNPNNGDNSALESAFELILNKDWTGTLRFIQNAGSRQQSDALFDHVIETFISEFCVLLPLATEDSVTDPGSQLGFSNNEQAVVAERLILFHNAGRIVLSDRQVQDFIRRLVVHLRADKDRALNVARFLPDDPVCLDFIQKYGPPVKEVINLKDMPGVQTTNQNGFSVGGTVRGLFRSQQERRFFEALTELYPGYLVYPNVALHAIADFDAVQHQLKPRERDYFFRALLDCVVFDPDNNHRPVVCFELDSPLHDDAFQIEKDTQKDHLLARAGLRLLRIRPGEANMTVEKFKRLLQELDPFSSSKPLYSTDESP